MSVEHVLLNHLDKPAKFLFLTLDEAASLFGAYVFGTLMHHNFIGLSVGILITLFLRNIKKRGGNCSIAQYIYWFFPTNKKSMAMYIPSYIREFKG